SLRSDPITIMVKPLPPDGRPGDFSGAVGRFRMAVEAKPPRVKIGEPITLTVRVSGEGNIDSVRLPVFRPGGDFKTYDPEVETKKRADGDRIGGEKIFKQVVIPLKEGEQVVPAVSFSWFDPVAAAYRTEKAKPIPIAVEPSPQEGTATLGEAITPGSAKKSIALLQKDILYIKDNPGDLVLSRRPFYRSGWYWAAHLVPVIIVLLVGRVQSQRDRLRSDRVYARKVRASRAARTRFKEAGRRLQAGKTAEFYASAHRAFVCYLGDKLGLPSGAVDYEAVAGKLSVAGLPPEFLAAVKNAFYVCDRARYAPGASDPSEGKHFLAAMEGIVDRLEKVKIR
ncbi:MAG: BatD family protein, partial [Candidatus Aureabacteria bacterium]|nr:BatD family protein [Candidatus Auribacterota bacterium]